MNTLSQWLTFIEQQHPQAIELGLERVREVADRMALEAIARQVVTVAGTNGKGSTVAFMEAIARAAGWRTGTYTSPHLHRYNERIRVDGREVADEMLVDAFNAVEAARRTRALTYFEYGTLAAARIFQNADLDLAILEIGMGGRLDAVNIFEPDVAVITTVGIDHTDWLGADREQIGYEKAGIARAWKPLVLGEPDPPSSVLRHAYALGADTIRAGCDFFHQPLDDHRWRWWNVNHERVLPLPTLAAPVQCANAATAITALEALNRRIREPAFAEGIRTANAPARLQGYQVKGVEIRVDVGHNPQAAAELAQWLRAQPVAGRTIAVFASLNDKDVMAVTMALEAVVDIWHLAGLDIPGGRAQSSEVLSERVSAAVLRKALRHHDVREALTLALRTALTGDRILVFGSFHTAAEAMTLLDNGLLGP